MKYELAPEQYKGETIRYVQNVIGDKKVVTASWKNKVVKRVLGAQSETKKLAGQKLRRIIDNYKG